MSHKSIVVNIGGESVKLSAVSKEGWNCKCVIKTGIKCEFINQVTE